jgi:hypothetical protein
MHACFRSDRFATNRNVDNLAWPGANDQVDRTAADGTIFDQGLFFLRSIDAEGKYFAAVRTGDLGFNGKFHVMQPQAGAQRRNKSDLKYRAGLGDRLCISCSRFLCFAKIELANPATIRLGNGYHVIANSDLFARFG